MLFIHLASAGWLKRRKVAWPRQMVHPWERGERASRQYQSGSRECREAVGHCSPQDAPSGRERAPAVSRGLGEAEIQVSTAAAGSASQGRHSWGPRRGPRGSWRHSRACVAASCRQDSSCPCLQSVSSWPKAAALLGQGCRAAPRRKAPEERERGRGRSPVAHLLPAVPGRHVLAAGSIRRRGGGCCRHTPL